MPLAQSLSLFFSSLASSINRLRAPHLCRDVHRRCSAQLCHPLAWFWQHHAGAQGYILEHHSSPTGLFLNCFTDSKNVYIVKKCKLKLWKLYFSWKIGIPFILMQNYTNAHAVYVSSECVSVFSVIFLRVNVRIIVAWFICFSSSALDGILSKLHSNEARTYTLSLSLSLQHTHTLSPLYYYTLQCICHVLGGSLPNLYCPSLCPFFQNLSNHFKWIHVAYVSVPHFYSNGFSVLKAPFLSHIMVR